MSLCTALYSTLDSLWFKLIFFIQNDSSSGSVECSVQQCPSFLHQSFMELFPGIGIQIGQLTVVSISQHTRNDMSAWSPDVEEERESLMASVR